MRRLSSVEYVQFKSVRWRQHLESYINFIIGQPLYLSYPSKIYTYTAHTRDNARVRFPASAKDFSTLHSVQIDSSAHPASYLVGTGVLSLGQSGRGVKFKTVYSPPSSVQVKIGGVMSPLPLFFNGVVFNEINTGSNFTYFVNCFQMTPNLHLK